MQLVTAVDLHPAGWVCETCGRPYREGEYAIGVLVGFTSDGTPVEGDYRCERCWEIQGRVSP